MWRLRAVLVLAALLAVGCSIITGPKGTDTTTSAGTAAITELEGFGLHILYQTPPGRERVINAYLTPRHLMMQTTGHKLNAIDRKRGVTSGVAILPGQTDFKVGEDEQAYYVASYGQLLAFDKDDGRTLWTKRLAFAPCSAPAVGPYYLYLGSQDGRLVAVPKGKALGWQFTIGSTISSAPVLTVRGIYITCGDGKLYCIDPAKHKPTWSFATDGAVRADAAILPDTIYLASTDSKLYALAAGMQVNRRYQQRWLIPYGVQSPVLDPVFFVKDTVYVHGRDTGIHAVDAKTGAGKWVYPGGKQFVTHTKAGTYLVTQDHKLVLVDNETGAEKGELDMGAYKFLPTNTDTDVIYLITDHGAVTACKPIAQ